MSTGCLAIIIVLFIISVTFLRSSKPLSAISVWALMVVPLFHLIGPEVTRLIVNLFHTDTMQTLIMFDVLALLISCIIVGLFGSTIKSRKIRVTYVLISACFNITIVWILVFDILSAYHMLG